MEVKESREREGGRGKGWDERIRGEQERRRGGEEERRRGGEEERRRGGEQESRRAGEQESRRAGEQEMRRGGEKMRGGEGSIPAEGRVLLIKTNKPCSGCKLIRSRSCLSKYPKSAS